MGAYSGSKTGDYSVFAIVGRPKKNTQVVFSSTLGAGFAAGVEEKATFHKPGKVYMYSENALAGGLLMKTLARRTGEACQLPTSNRPGRSSRRET